MNHLVHIPVLLNEVVQAFSNVDDGYIIDCTLGFGGHSKALLQEFPKAKIIACDQDETSINFCKNFFKNENRIQILKQNFSSILDNVNTNNIKGILADIGVSSLQLDENSRGFNLNSDELDMRMDKNLNINAKMIINEYSQNELERIFRDFGELKMAQKIAQKIINARNKTEILSSKQLCQIIGNEKIFGRNVNIAKLVFQAIRIEVNNELGVLKNLLQSIENKKFAQCRVCIICFHSLEDRIVKQFFKKWSKSCICDENAIKCTCGNNHSLGKIINKKPITANENELKLNSRAACAKMRIFEFN